MEAKKSEKRKTQETNRQGDPKKPVTDKNGISPWGLVQKALEKVPFVKYALGIGGIAAVIAIVRSYITDLRIAVFGTVIMLVLMTVLYVLDRKSKEGGKKVLIWFSLILTILTTSCLFTSVFFKWPVNLQHFIQEQKDSNTDNTGQTGKAKHDTATSVVSTLADTIVKRNGKVEESKPRDSASAFASVRKSGNDPARKNNQVENRNSLESLIQQGQKLADSIDNNKNRFIDSRAVSDWVNNSLGRLNDESKNDFKRFKETENPRQKPEIEKMLDLLRNEKK